MTIRFNAFVEAAEKYYYKHRGYVRRGQAYSNVLHEWDPELSRKIHSTEADCFYLDEHLPAFCEIVLRELPEYISACAHSKPESLTACKVCRESNV